MSNPTLIRAFPTDIELRAGQRIISGIAAPYDEENVIWESSGRSYTEILRHGVFARSIAQRGDRVKLLALHDQRGRFALGKAINLREDKRGLFAEFQLSQTRDADEVLGQIQDGTLTDLSIGFQSVKDQWNRARDYVERLEAKLIEVSIVNIGALAGARITGVRSALPDGTPSYSLSRAQARIRLMEMESK